jgi:hypothetical protein
MLALDAEDLAAFADGPFVTESSTSAETSG